ncbi:MAG TPA: 50S ribosomal protein L35 [Gaiellaceae bacterium]|nr:50S ribosomal protein L35 [Gaiellaceae bacterium]
MPKVKRSSAAKKRFRLTGSGKLLRRRGMLSHNLGKKSEKRKRRLAGNTEVHGANERAVRAQLGRK